MNDWFLHGVTDINALSAFLLLLVAPLPAACVMVRGLPARPRSHVGLLVTLGWVALHITLTTTLAAVGRFAPVPALTGSGLLFLTGLFLLIRTGQARRTAPCAHGAPDPSVRFRLLWLTLSLITLLLLGNLLIQPVTDYDSLYYHLPFMANLHATGQFTPQSVAPVVAWYPYGWEVLCALFLLPIDGDIFVALPNLVVWGLLGLAVYVIACQLGASRLASAAAVLLLLTLPLVLDQLNSLRVDLALAALFLAGIAVVTMLLSPADTRGQPGESVGKRPAHLVLFVVISMLLLPAIKTSGIIYSGLLALLWLLCTWSTKQPLRPLIQWLPWLPTLVAIGVLCTTLFWYLRNWFLYANPLGTVEVRLGTWLIFPGSTTSAMVQQSTLAALFAVTDATHRQLYWLQVVQQGNLALLGLLLFALMALFYLRRSPQRPTVLVLLGGTLLLFFLYWSTPYSGDDGSFGYQLNGPWVGQAMRFALPALGLLAVLAALGASEYETRARYGAPMIVSIAITLALATSAQRSTLYGAATGLIALCLLGYGLLHKRLSIPIRKRLLPPGKAVGVTGALLVLVLLIALMPLFQRLHSQRRVQAYGALPTLIDALTLPGATVAAFYSHQSYLANGQTLQRQVVQMPTDFADPAALQAWFHSNEITLVIVGPLRPEWQNNPMLGWLDAPGAPYTLLHDGFPDHPRLYRVQE